MPDFYKRLTILSTIVVILVTILTLYLFSKTPEIASVNSALVFQNFNMAKEMKIKGEKEYRIRQHYIDSLRSNLDAAPSEDIKKQIVQQIISEQESLDQFGESFASGESDKIWSRIRLYAQEYSKEQGYNIILGIQPDGNILFASGDTDITVDFVNYINKKYEGYK